MLIQGSVGQPSTTSIPAGTTPTIRQGQLGDVIVSELHGRFYEQVYRANLFSVGTTGVVALSANTVSLTSTTTPILGIYNPATSTNNCVVLQASLQAFINTFTTPVSAGAFVWASSVGNTAVSTGVTPFNRKTLASAGAQGRGFAGATALTGLTNNLVIFEGSDFVSPTALTYGTIVAPTAGTSLTSFGGVQNFDGSIIVPPGGVLALLNTTSTTTMSYTGRLLWEEVPL